MNNNITGKKLEIEPQKNKGLLFSLVGVLTLVVAIIGATYAFFQLTASNNNISGSAANVGLDLQIKKVGGYSDGDLVPQYGTSINAAATNACTDGNNTICHMYEIQLLNTGSTDITVSGTISFSGIEQMTNLKWSIYDPNVSSEFSIPGISASEDATSIGESITIPKSSDAFIIMVVWIEETGSIQYDTGTYTATVTYTSTDGQGITSTITE